MFVYEWKTQNAQTCLPVLRARLNKQKLLQTLRKARIKLFCIYFYSKSLYCPEHAVHINVNRDEWFLTCEVDRGLLEKMFGMQGKHLVNVINFHPDQSALERGEIKARGTKSWIPGRISRGGGMHSKPVALDLQSHFTLLYNKLNKKQLSQTI